MALKHVVRQGYRLYGIMIVVWAGWSAVWMGAGLEMAPATVGTGWLLIAAYGGLLVLTMGGLRVSSDYQLFRTDAKQSRIRRFNNHVLSSGPLHLYVIALAAWSFLTVEWWVINLGFLGRTIVAYGWFLIALYGVGLSLSLAAKHEEALAEELDEVAPVEVGSDS